MGLFEWLAMIVLSIVAIVLWLVMWGFLAIVVVVSIFIAVVYLWERHWFIRPDLPRRSINDSGARAEKYRRAGISKQAVRCEDWILELGARALKLPNARLEIMQKGSIDAEFLFRVLDPSGAVALYSARLLSKGWWIWLEEIEFSPVSDSRIDGRIRDSRTNAYLSPWVIHVSGAYGHQIFSEFVEYEADFLDDNNR